MDWRLRYTGFCCVWEIAIPNTKARPQLDLKGKIFPCFLPAFGFLQSLKVVAWTEKNFKKKYFDLVLGNFNSSHRYLSQISFTKWQKKYLTSYWFVKQGISEGPEWFQTDSKWVYKSDSDSFDHLQRCNRGGIFEATSAQLHGNAITRILFICKLKS